MRAWSLSPLLLVCAGCAVRLPNPANIGIRAKATVRVDAHVQASAPRAPEPVVALQGAPVVEFFGVPLEGADDVVFVLDCSGSMSNLAQGRIAQIAPAPSAPPPSGTGSPPAVGAPGAGSAEPPPPPPASAEPPLAPAAGPTDTSQPAAPVPVTTSHTKIEVAQSELVEALQKLPAGTRMNVVFFNSDLEAFAPTMVPLEESSRQGLIDFVKEQSATGSTALAPAMRTAFLMNARRVVLLSDGLGNVGGNAQAVLRDAREAMRGGVRIDTIGLGSGQDAQLLGALASESGGLYQAL